MALSRRLFLKGLALTAAGLAVPAAALPDSDPARRVWALDRAMLASAATLVEAKGFADAAGRVLVAAKEAERACAGLALFTTPTPQQIAAFMEHSAALRPDDASIHPNNIAVQFQRNETLALGAEA